MASIRASGFKSYDSARIKARVEFREYIRRFSGFYDAEREALEFDKVRTKNMSALARWDAEQASNTWIRQALRKDGTYKRHGMVYDPSIARQTMEDMGMEGYRSLGSPSSSPRGGSGGFFRSKHWRPYDEPARRLNPIAAGSAPSGAGRPATGGSGTMLSRFGGTKGFGGKGLMGASASRVRSAKEMFMNPATFMRRALIFWAADEITRGYSRAAGWDKVSYLDDSVSVEAKIAPPDRMAETILRGAGGILAGGVGSMGAPFRRVMAMSPTMQVIFGPAEVARKEALADAAVEWASGGFRGMSPFEIQDKFGEESMKAAAEVSRQVKAKAIDKFDRSVDRTIDRMQDALAARGVGTIDQIKTRYKQTGDAHKALKRMTAQEALNAPSMSDIQNQVLNRMKQQP